MPAAHLAEGWPMAWYPPEFQPVLAVGVAELDDAGRLIAGNAGFLTLVAGVAQNAAGAPVAKFFIQPDFASLLRLSPAAGGEIYRGLLTIGEYDGRTRTLQGCVWRREGRIRVLAEYDVAEQERLNDIVLQLNERYAEAQFALAQANIRLRQRDAMITALSLTDALTGVGNRRRLDEALIQEISRAERGTEYLSALMVDIDHFKRVNDNYGHDVGDKALAALGGLLHAETRATDIVARFGGEEFVVLMPSTDLAHGVVMAERIRSALEAVRIEPLKEPVTLSAGVAEFIIGEAPAAFLRRIDVALFRAKGEGRNRVVADQGSAAADFSGAAVRNDRPIGQPAATIGAVVSPARE